MIKLDESLHGVTVVIPTNDREIPGSIPRRYNLQIEITSSLANCCYFVLCMCIHVYVIIIDLKKFGCRWRKRIDMRAGLCVHQ